MPEFNEPLIAIFPTTCWTETIVGSLPLCLIPEFSAYIRIWLMKAWRTDTRKSLYYDPLALTDITVPARRLDQLRQRPRPYRYRLRCTVGDLVEEIKCSVSKISKSYVMYIHT